MHCTFDTRAQQIVAFTGARARCRIAADHLVSQGYHEIDFAPGSILDHLEILRLSSDRFASCVSDTEDNTDHLCAPLARVMIRRTIDAAAAGEGRIVIPHIPRDMMKIVTTMGGLVIGLGVENRNELAVAFDVSHADIPDCLDYLMRETLENKAVAA